MNEKSYGDKIHMFILGGHSVLLETNYDLYLIWLVYYYYDRILWGHTYK